MTNTQPAQASDERTKFDVAMRATVVTDSLTDADLDWQWTHHSGKLWRAARATAQPPVIPAAGAADDAKDAALYRLMKGADFTEQYCEYVQACLNDEPTDELDDLIDAAISAQQGPEGKQ